MQAGTSTAGLLLSSNQRSLPKEKGHVLEHLFVQPDLHWIALCSDWVDFGMVSDTECLKGQQAPNNINI
jgi:hypothetical protein